jgi:hypothetical protein
VHTSFFEQEDGTMPNRYDASTKAKAIRLVREHRGQADALMPGALITVKMSQ